MNSAASSSDPTARLTEALALVDRLRQLMDLEFETLKTQELDRFDALQPAKAELMDAVAQASPDAATLQQDPAWASLKEALLECRDLHRRNAVLIERKLEAIRNALQSLTLATQTSSVDVYDRLGQVARFQRGRGYQEA